MPTTPATTISMSRMNPAQSGIGLKLTPSNSPYYRPSGAKSPNKTSRQSNEASLLSLRRIIGITAASPSAFDCLETSKSFAYTAGAAAVFVKLGDSFQLSQRFFRARPTAVPSSSTSSSCNPSSPVGTLPGARSRYFGGGRDAGVSPLGSDSPMGDWGDSPSSRTWTARERIKAASCVSLSPNGRFIAVGEVRAGVRHVKVWRVEETKANSPSKSRFLSEGKGSSSPSTPTSTPKSLAGRNCLLGQMLDTTFTCAARIPNEKVVLCSQSGEVCLVDDSDKAQRLSKIGKLEFGISCLSLNSEANQLWIGGTNGNLRRSVHIFSIDLLGPDPQLGPAAVELPAHPDAVMGVRALSQPHYLSASYFTWSRGGMIIFWGPDGQRKGEMRVDLEHAPTNDDELSNELRVVQASPNSNFLVSGDRLGVLRIMDGVSGEIYFQTKSHENEIMDIAIFESDSKTLVASCSRDRTIQLFHRVNTSWTLAQTMEEHTSCVCRLMFWHDGDALISCSADRTILIRKSASREVDGEALVAYVPSQTLGLRAAPVSMAASIEEPDVIVVSTLDRCIHRFHMSSGRNVQTFRASDTENGDAVVMDSLILSKPRPTLGGSNLIIGISSTDKSLRVYDENGVLMSKEWGHTEGVSNLALVEATSPAIDQFSTSTLVSTGVDGTIMVYDLATKGQGSREDTEGIEASQDSPSTKEFVASKTPLRKVLSKSDLAGFQKHSSTQEIPPLPPKSNRSPPRSVRRKASNISLSQSTRLGLAFRESPGGVENSPTPMSRETGGRKSRSHDRSPSPPSPRSRAPPSAGKRPSLNARFRTKSAGHLGETGQLCQSLRIYRANLGSSSEGPQLEGLKELERELHLTTKALADKLMRPEEMTGMDVSKLLDNYSERLVEMIDEKLTLGSRRNGSESSEALGLVTPPNAIGEG
ncbi:MAG: hypothetical protein M1837_005517 [Sclerophora amabilis]|nr:MAG: hypothetical protein M1837_005517 [Sclerophora amabilis]